MIEVVFDGLALLFWSNFVGKLPMFVFINEARFFFVYLWPRTTDRTTAVVRVHRPISPVPTGTVRQNIISKISVTKHQKNLCKKCFQLLFFD